MTQPINCCYISAYSTLRKEHAPLKAASLFKGTELEAVVVVVESAASTLTPVPVSVTGYQPLKGNDRWSAIYYGNETMLF